MLVDAVYFEPQPIAVVDGTTLNGMPQTFAILESMVPNNATEVQLMSFFTSGSVMPTALFTARITTTRNNRNYHYYQMLHTYSQNAVSFESMVKWYPVGSVKAERNVTVTCPNIPASRIGFWLYATAYRV